MISQSVNLFEARLRRGYFFFSVGVLVFAFVCMLTLFAIGNLSFDVIIGLSILVSGSALFSFLGLFPELKLNAEGISTRAGRIAWENVAIARVQRVAYGQGNNRFLVIVFVEHSSLSLRFKLVHSLRFPFFPKHTIEGFELSPSSSIILSIPETDFNDEQINQKLREFQLKFNP